MFTSIENQKDVRKAVADWQSKFTENAIKLKGLRGTVYWHRHAKVWGFFSGYRRGKRFRYWNTFGSIPSKFRKNMRVEINPPDVGINRGTQGLLACGSDGRRWLLHKGRMSIPGFGITSEHFGAITTLKFDRVELSDGSQTDAYVVACLDDDAEILQADVGSYVAECERIRLFYDKGQSALDVEDAIHNFEKGFPEKTGKYTVPPQDKKTIDKIHADVWTSLVAFLDRIDVSHSNKRIGRCGPDLFTTDTRKVLFEIKSNSSMSDMQKAIGQLIIYEKMLKSSFKKVLVCPEPFSDAIIEIISDLKIDILLYRRKGKIIRFDEEKLRILLEEH